jgi:hypothetical protein
MTDSTAKPGQPEGPSEGVNQNPAQQPPPEQAEQLEPAKPAESTEQAAAGQPAAPESEPADKAQDEVAEQPTLEQPPTEQPAQQVPASQPAEQAPPPQPPIPPAASAPKGPRVGVIIGAVLAVLALLACGTGGWLLYRNIAEDRAHKVGKCIKRVNDKRAKPVNCKNKDAYRIFKRFNNTTDERRCPTRDTELIFINESDDYVLCLKKAN